MANVTMTTDRERALYILRSETWAIDPRHLTYMADVLGSEEAMIEATLEARRPITRLRTPGAIAVMPVHGVIQKRGNILMQLFGGTSTDVLGQMIDIAMSDPKISAIVLDVDSPGGSVYGVEELAAKIRAHKGKPILAVANTLMASAAYYIASAADEIIASPSAEVGSIGVIAMHLDISEALANAGIKPTLITAGKYKAEGTPFEPLTEEAHGAIQKRIDEYYGMFVRAVAAGRGVAQSKVRNGFGEGRVVSPQTALDEGMIDRIDTLENVLNSLSGRRNPVATTSSGAHAETFRVRVHNGQVLDDDATGVDDYELDEWYDGYYEPMAEEDIEAPYPNEHACRLREPSDFQSRSFRRVTRNHEGKDYSVIRGRLKSNGNWEDQAFRYPRDSWSTSEARKHCREHDGKVFEPATGGASSEECCGESLEAKRRRLDLLERS